MKLVRYALFACFILLSFTNCSYSEFEAKSQQLGSSSGLMQTNQVIKVQSTTGLDDVAKINNAVAAAKRSGVATEIVLEPRTYRLDCPATRNFCFEWTGLSNIRFKGSGGTKFLVTSPRAGLVYLTFSSQIEFVGITVDYETPPFTQGRVIAVNQTQFDYVVDAGYIEPNHPALNDDVFAKGRMAVASIYLPNAPVLKQIPTDNLAVVSLPQNIGPRTWRVTTNRSMNAEMAVGDRFAFGPRGNSAFLMVNVTNLTFSQVNIFTSPSLAFGIVRCEGAIRLDQVQLVVGPGTNRAMSTVADALHIQDTRGQVSVTNSRFEGMGDDVYNSYSPGLKVVSRSGANNEVVQLTGGYAAGYRVGDLVQFWDPNHSVARLGSAGEARIKAVSTTPGGISVTLDRSLASVFPGDTAYNVMLAAPNAVLSGNRFQSFRGIVRVRGAGTSFINSQFDDARNAKFFIASDAFWNEGPTVGLPSVSGVNVVGGSPIYLGQNMQVITRAPAGNPTVPPTTPPPTTTPPASAGWVNLYRLKEPTSGRELISVLTREGSYVSDGMVFRISQVTRTGFTVPFVRCIIGSGGHFMSTDLNCEGSRREGILGYIAPASISEARKPLYRCYHATQGHSIALSPQECANKGARLEGMYGYIP